MFRQGRHDDSMAVNHVAQPGTCLAFISVAGSSCRSSKFPLGVTKIRYSIVPKGVTEIDSNRSATRPLPKGASHRSLPQMI